MRTVAVLLVGVLAAGLVLVFALDPSPEPDEAGLAAPHGDGAGRTGEEPAALEGRGPIAASVAPRDPQREREVVGTVVDASGAPVAGARVVVAFDGVETSASSGAEGDFIVAVVLPAGTAPVAADVEASHEDDTASRRVTLRDEDDLLRDVTRPIDVGELRLRESFELLVRVVGGDPTKTAVHTALLEVPPRRSRRAEVDRHGVARFPGLVEGLYRLVGVSEGRGRAVTIRRLPPQDRRPIVLELPEERVVKVFVRSGKSGDPIAGASVTVTESLVGEGTGTRIPLVGSRYDATTDDQGIAWIRGLARDDTVFVAAEAAGHGPLPLQGFVTATPSEDVVHVGLPPLRTLRWKVVPETLPVPPDGTAVALLPHPRVGIPSGGRIEDGHLVVDGWSSFGVEVCAVAPDGALALASATGKRTESPIAFRPPASVDVVLRNESGGPLPGWRVVGLGSGMVSRAAVTDAAGRATLSGFCNGPGGIVGITTVPPAAAGTDARTFRLGGLRLDRGERRLEATIPDVRDVEVLVRLDGRVGLPPKTDPLTLRLLGSPARWVERDEPSGVLRSRWRPGPLDDRFTTFVEVPGWIGTLDTRQIAPGRPPTLLRMSVQLLRPAVFEVQVRLPPDGAHAVVLETSGNGASWTRTGSLGELATAQQADHGVVRFPRVVPGLYRAVDELTGAASEPLRVSGAPDTGVVTLDLSQAVWLEGRVRGPTGTPPAESTSIEVGLAEPGAKARPSRRASMRPDGTFRIRVLWDQPQRLLARHPTLRNSPAEGLLVAEPPKAELVLQLLAR